ncbi:hypothetical protein [Spongiimicrobium salis]|uniref:hypothetical protein n=1 Tax=Spongiimicrobium salis TaxID=1667022 RepID=UPI00374D4920
MSSTTAKNLTPKGKKIANYYSKNILKSRPSDTDYDRLIRESVQFLFDRSLDLTDLDSEDSIHDPVMIIGLPHLENLNGLTFEIQKGKDNFFRFIPLGITIYNFTDHSLIAYQCTFDPRTNNALNEGTFEYFYNEIVSFETFSESGTVTDYNWRDKIVNSIPLLDSLIRTGKIHQYDYTQKFKLTTTGGTSISVILKEGVLKEVSDGGEFSLTEALKSISIVRRIIREKKSYTRKDSYSED